MSLLDFIKNNVNSGSQYNNSNSNMNQNLNNTYDNLLEQLLTQSASKLFNVTQFQRPPVILDPGEIKECIDADYEILDEEQFKEYLHDNFISQMGDGDISDLLNKFIENNLSKQELKNTAFKTLDRFLINNKYFNIMEKYFGADLSYEIKEHFLKEIKERFE